VNVSDALMRSVIAVLIFTIPMACAPITLESSPLIVTSGDPNDIRYATRLGAGYDGVGRLLVDRTDGGVACTASLLGSGRQVLTAAHCVTDNSGFLNAFGAEVSFITSAGEEKILVSSYSVHPDWNGNVKAGADVAVLTLSHTAPALVDRYALYGDTREIGAAVEVVGFGLTGTGSSGAIIDDGKRRRGRNRLDATARETVGRLPGWTAGTNVLLSDFDDGSRRHDALGLFFNISDLGMGLGEAIPAPGDSGGPGLIGGRIAVISSFGARLSRADGGTSDVDSLLNWTTGELTGFTRVSSYESWIEDQVHPIPEPGYFVPVGVSFLTTLFRHFRRHTRS
jgi:hypothetical protein